MIRYTTKPDFVTPRYSRTLLTYSKTVDTSYRVDFSPSGRAHLIMLTTGFKLGELLIPWMEGTLLTVLLLTLLQNHEG